MVLSSKTIRSGTALKTEICIVGSGPAGLALARRLADRGLKVLVLEGSRDVRPAQRASGMAPPKSSDPIVQSVYDGELGGTLGTIDPTFLTRSRSRSLGGTSAWWAGWCTPLEREAWAPVNGHRSLWPIGYEQLRSFDSISCNLLGLDELAFDMQGADALVESHPDVEDLPLSYRHVRRILYHVPSHQNRQQWLLNKSHFEVSKQISVILNAHVRNVRLDSGADSVVRLEVQALDGKRPGSTFTVSAKRYVLAAGAIENVRLLLRSGEHGSLLNKLPCLGRGFSIHPVLRAAAIAKGPAVSSRSAQLYTSQTNWGRRNQTSGFAGLVSTVSVGKGQFRVLLRFNKDRTVANIDLSWESPSAVSDKIGLSRQGSDLFGDPSVRVSWSLTNEDICVFDSALEALASALEPISWNIRPNVLFENGRSGIRVVGDTLLVGEHHLGGTRMSVSAVDGVVDSSCRVHGVSNLYIAGSSVFSRPGSANPTFSIVALAARLGDTMDV